MTHLIAIKGSKDGLRLQLDEAAVWRDVVAALRGQFEQGAQFFNGAKVLVDVGERALGQDDLTELIELMQLHNIAAESIASTSRESRNAARAAGVVARPLARPAAADDRSDDLFLRRTLRSGQILRHSGSLTLIGDINAGGEVIVGGSVVVWGRLRGTVHAGAFGDRAATVGALELAPTQLRIADLIARQLEGGGRQPEVAAVDRDQIRVIAWETLRKERGQS